MADVGPDRSRAASPPESEPGERGQLILVTALGLAILFVTLALILNTAIYTENLASRSGDIGGGTDAVRFHDAARDAVGGLIDYVNAHNNTSHSTLESNLTAGIDVFENHSARLFASGDRAVEVSFESTVDGTRIAQSEPDRNFTNTNRETDWTVVEEVNNARAIEINVTDDTNLQSFGSVDVFELVLEDTSGATWRLNVTNDPTRVVGIENGSGDTFTCSASSTPEINLSGGTVDGTQCDGLDFAEDIDTPYEIRINNGDNINGTYSLIVDNASLADDVESGTNTHLVEDGSGQPFAAHALYSANVTVKYETPRLFYNTTVQVVPGESND